MPHSKKRRVALQRVERLWIVGLHGAKESGKTTSATHIETQYNAAVLAFADPLKRAAQELFGFTQAQVETTEGKAQVDEYWGLTPREVLQRLGTEGMRELFGPDFFVRRLRQRLRLAKAAGVSRVVIHDVRFPEEAEFIRRKGGRVVYIQRGPPPADPAALHPSERPLPPELIDVTIVNNGTLQDLFDKLDGVI